MRRPNPNRRKAITLAETILSMTIMTIVMGTTTGAIQMITLQGNKKQFEEKTRAESAIALHQLRSEIAFATNMSVMSDKVIEFTTPDVDGDGSDDVLRYEWSGTTGDPLKRLINGVLDYESVSDVTDFSMFYDLQVLETTDAGGTPQSPSSTLLKVGKGTARVTNVVGVATPIAQIIVPDLPPEAINWSIDSVACRIRRSGASIGRVRPIIKPTTASGVPGWKQLEVGTSITDDDLPTNAFTWVTRSFTRVTGLDPSKSVAFCLHEEKAANTVDVRCVTAPTDGASMLATSANWGLTWSKDPGTSMKVRVKGHYEMPVAGGSISRGFVRDVVFAVTVNQQATDRTYRTAGRSLNCAKFSGVDLTNVPTVITP